MKEVRKKKYYFQKPFNLLSDEEVEECLHNEVFQRQEFDNHIKEVSHNLKIDEEIVRDVMMQYITSIMYMLNTVRKIKTKINIYSFFSFRIEAGKRI